jgi:phosphatidylcholine synthase
MEPADRRPRQRTRATAAFAVHLVTASGAGLALLAMMEAVREHWSAMFGWLGLALLIDALDGPLARKFDVAGLQPRWSGEVLDLVVDFTTYVFVPAYAIVASRLLLPVAGPILACAIVISAALYFADRDMKTDDNHFRGFPALWNAAAFYLFLLQPSPLVGTLVIAGLVVLTFTPLRVLHPVRVKRLRGVSVALLGLWAALSIYTLLADFDVSWPVKLALCAIALYVICLDAIVKTLGRS